MTLEQYQELFEKYTKKQSYFTNIGFDIIAADYKEMIDVISSAIEMKKKLENEITST